MLGHWPMDESLPSHRHLLTKSPPVIPAHPATGLPIIEVPQAVKLPTLPHSGTLFASPTSSFGSAFQMTRCGHSAKGIWDATSEPSVDCELAGVRDLAIAIAVERAARVGRGEGGIELAHCIVDAASRVAALAAGEAALAL
jgi:hypothetical protein